MSKLGQIAEVIGGSHVLGTHQPLNDYYAAKAVRDAGRKGNYITRFQVVRHALKNYRVTVTLDGERTRIYRPETQQEIFI